MGRPKKVQLNSVGLKGDEPIPTEYLNEALGYEPPINTIKFDSALFLAAAQIAGALAAGVGGYSPTITKASIKIARELREALGD